MVESSVTVAVSSSETSVTMLAYASSIFALESSELVVVTVVDGSGPRMESMSEAKFTGVDGCRLSDTTEILS